ncbi:MAG TPA: cytochrome P450 [Aliidongia sp.]|nr:cytochrome P450 [Aliidongia sp.]
MSTVEEIVPLPRLAGVTPPEGQLSFWKFFRMARHNGLAVIPRSAYEQPVIEQNILGFRTYLINDPAGVREVLLDHVAEYPKTSLEKRALGLAVGRGLLTSDGEVWRAHRRIMAPSFDHRSIQGYAPVMVEATDRQADRWDAEPGGQVIDIADAMMHVTLDIIARTMFSAETAHMAGLVERTIRGFQAMADFGVPDLLPVIGPLRWRMHERRSRAIFADFDREIRRLIEGRAADPTSGGPDLLGRLIAARDEETGGGMGAEELRDQVVTIFLAGHETTALAMTWTWYLLSQHPAALAKLENELDAVVGDRAPRHEDLPKLPYARMVVEEAMRLYPPAPGLSARLATKERVIAGTRVPKGAAVAVMPWVLHRHRLLWDEPDRFDPERFSPERSVGRHRFAYLPFGGGPRICIGLAFAMVEAVLILATLARRYRFHLMPDQVIDPHQAITLRPRYGMKMRLERRI